VLQHEPTKIVCDALSPLNVSWKNDIKIGIMDYEGTNLAEPAQDGVLNFRFL
jgi:hypothetical protein